MNRTYPRLLLLIAALAGGLLACSTGAQLGGTPPLPGAGTVLPAPPAANPPPSAPLLLQGQDAGRSVTLRVGQGLDLRLRDRQWSLPVVDAKILAPAPLNEALLRGVSGWNYRALAPGTTTLRTEGACVPSTSGVSCHSILVYQVTITVTPAAPALAIPPGPRAVSVTVSRSVAPGNNLPPPTTPTVPVGPLLPGPGPSASPTSATLGMNITQAEYAQALAKWRTRGVLDYEITLFDGTGQEQFQKVRLRIQIVNGEPQVVNGTDLNGDQPRVISLGALRTYDLDILRSLSVEGQLRFLGKLFTGEFTPPAGFYAYYDVAFDPVLGYPTRLYSTELEGGRGILDSGIRYDVLGMRILKSTIPGMPKTGHPGP